MSDPDQAPAANLLELSFAQDIRRLTTGFQGREWVLAEVDAWLRRSGETFFLLTGEAGIGKSAIAARLTQARQDIAACHFCIAGRNATIVPRTVFRSLAAQLARRLPGYGLALARTIRPSDLSIHVDIPIGTMRGGEVVGVIIERLAVAEARQEMETLLAAPLRAMPDPGHPVVILVDALDEAFTYSPHDNLAALLAGLRDLPPWARLLLTTRPEERVLSYYRDAPKYVVAAESPPNREDLRRYARHRASQPALRARLAAAPQPIAPEALL